MLLAYEGTTQAPKRERTTPAEVHRYLNKRGAALKADREDGGWLDHWRDISDYQLPRRGRFLARNPRRGRKVNKNILSHVPYRAAEIAANGMNAGLTSKSRPWFVLTCAEELKALPGVRRWLKQCTKLILQWMDSSNLYTVLPEIYVEMLVFGTHASVVMEDFNTLFRIECLTAGEYCLAVDAKGIPHTLYRECEYTVEQLVDEFGKENCSREVREAFEAKRFDQRVAVCHMIERNRDIMPGEDGAHGMPFRSVYWEPKCKEKERFLQYKGFEENPLLAPRWSVSDNEPYGRGPGMDAQPECKQLKQAIIRKEQGKERITVGAMVAPASLKNAGANLTPGAISYIDSTEDASFRPVYDRRYYDPELELQQKDIAELKADIRTIYYNDLFFAISQMQGVQPRNVLEIMERKEEKLQQIGSGIERFETEFLERLIERIWAIAVRHDMLPPTPPALENKPVKPFFVGPLALAQRSQDVMALERTLGLVGNLAKSFPEVGDKVDVDAAIDEYADLTNAPPALLRDAAEVAAIRAKRAREQKEREIMAAAPGAIQQIASGAELLSKTRLGNGRTALDQVEAAL